MMSGEVKAGTRTGVPETHTPPPRSAPLIMTDAGMVSGEAFQGPPGPAGGVESWNGRVGTVTFERGDLSAVDSPVLSGTVTAGSLLVSGNTLSQSLTVLGSGTINQPVLQGQAIAQGNLLVEGATQLQGLATLQQPALQGVTDGSNAPQGQVGEYLFVPLSGAGVPVPSNGVAAVRGITLSPGDWEVSGVAFFSWTGQDGTMAAVSIGLTANQSALPDGVRLFTGLRSGTLLRVDGVRINVPSGQVAYLNCEQSVPAGGTCTAAGQMSARRVR